MRKNVLKALGDTSTRYSMFPIRYEIFPKRGERRRYRSVRGCFLGGDGL